VLLQPGWGTYGGLVRQLWSFAGDSDRPDVNQTLLQPFINYNLPNGWYLITDIIITANWGAKKSSDRWTVPLGGGVGKLFKIGNQPINSRIEAYYNIEKPDNGPECFPNKKVSKRRRQKMKKMNLLKIFAGIAISFALCAGFSWD
jgi:hypothetical protein